MGEKSPIPIVYMLKSSLRNHDRRYWVTLSGESYGSESYSGRNGYLRSRSGNNCQIYSRSGRNVNFDYRSWTIWPR